MSSFGVSPGKRLRKLARDLYSRSPLSNQMVANHQRENHFGFESLEPRMVLSSTPLITEFMASNDTTLTDGDGAHSDWIEVHNPTASTIDLAGWHLTDSDTNLNKWEFPDLPQSELDPGEYLVVFASGQNVENYIDPAGNLHTDFKLTSGGEYLALTMPDESIAHEYSPNYPVQFADISYGLATTADETTLVADGAEVEIHVPTNNSLGLTWTEPTFTPDGSWITESSPGVTATTGVGYATTAAVSNLVSHWPLNEPVGTSGVASVVDAASSGNDGTPVGGVTFGSSGANAFTDNAASFSNGSIDVPYDSSLNPASFTFTAWARPTTTSGFQSLVTSRNDTGNNQGFIIYNNNNGSWTFWTGNGGSGWDTLDGPAVMTNTWQHLAISYDANTDTKILYVNGILEASDTGGSQYLPNTSRDLHIGGGGDLGDQYRFEGQIDDAALFDTALDQATIQAYMDSGVPDSAEADFGNSINTDLTTAMHTNSASAYLRVPFTVADPSALDTLTLRMKYDDGFAAYLNGTLVASQNAPASPTASSTATTTHSDSLAVLFENFDISDSVSLLQPGDNVLAIHGLNIDASDEDFLIVPELIGLDSSTATSVQGYFVSPTPGTANPNSVDEIGPTIGTVEHGDTIPTVSDPLIVTAEVNAVVSPVADVTLHYRVMYGSEIAVTMADNGLGNDAIAADGIYTGTIPAGVASAGQMLRYYVTASDTTANTRRAPALIDVTGNKQSAEYFGTVIADPSLSSQLPIFQWFTANESASHTRSGTRASVFYNGEFYDNVFVRRRGGATNSSSSQKFVFDQTHEFKLNEEAGRVGEININGAGADSSSIRQTLSFETFHRAGNAGSISFLTMMQVNSSFDRVGVVIEQVDEDFLERNDYDPDGALYKFVQRSNLDPVFNDTITGIEKKTRVDEGFSDVQALVDGLNLSNETARHNFVFDNLNMPQVINYLAVRSIIQDADDLRKNFYMYRDTNGTQEWSIFPWDKDFTFGVLGDGGTFLKHPFFGDEEHKKQNANQWNVMYDVLFEDPTTQEMYLRRLRTLMDELLESSPGFFEQRVEELFAPADPHPGPSTSGKNSVLNYFPGRRNDLFNTYGPGSTPHVPGEQIPFAQVGNPNITFGTFEHNPSSGNQDQEYIELVNSNSVAVDISGWKLTGGITHVFQPGTVIPANSSMYVTPDSKDFRNRSSGPSGGQGLLVQQWDSGHLSNFGETVQLLAADDSQIDSFTTPVTPSPEQLYLRIAELNYNPHGPQTHLGEPDVDPDFFEFVEFVNTSTTETIDLAGVHFSDGIDFQFGFSAASALLYADFNAGSDGFAYQDDLFNGTNNPTFASGTHQPSGGPASDGALQVYLDESTNGNRGSASGGWTRQFTLDQAETITVSLDFRMIMGHGFESDEFGEAILEIDGNRLGNATNNSLIHTSGDGQNPSTPPVDSGWQSDSFQLQLGAGTHTIRVGGYNNKSTFSDEDVEFFFDNILIQTQQDIPPVLLLPGERVVIVRNQAAFESRYGTEVNIAGEFADNTQLSNGGEKIKLNDNSGSTIHEFTYDDEMGWPLLADGQGRTLEVIDTEGDYNSPSNWQDSAAIGGSPGTSGEFSNSGDFDGDNDVDGADFLAWQRGYGMSGSASPQDGDADGDQDVDDADLGIWGSQFGSVSPLTAASISVESFSVDSSSVVVEEAESTTTDLAAYAQIAAYSASVAEEQIAQDAHDRVFESYLDPQSKDFQPEPAKFHASALLSSGEFFGIMGGHNILPEETQVDDEDLWEQLEWSNELLIRY